ncbi:L-2-amino-thiazoline-4-carboxylic acid hydrolase [Serpentinicella alkaliphila]|uniref:L-2-amino-thiazoline-4-carboxylic acid hydrolase-like protein n=1 Tax=Serpentinicella alkaliphila TaxID=1734049 RepID=A0A4R2T870_9FIRM|nr:L-2-amino-thiazoline-4-carboxylic acid hydrolase [Serpentinicella alkaliphila]QUH25613.1 L-2-amino-thiazoline-4-carboxylic acid hydrolase [Serpentinicella alkaliphila]TCP98395.1 L-2-amino-thiazoline-4-carboxylic acid hydrolase-like protein [Serpentinicella alkaliphila]
MSEKVYTQQELTDAFRAAIEDRAKWFYLLLKYAKLENADSDKIAEQAITEFGEMKGKAIGKADTAKDFANALLTGHARQAFEMDPVKLEENESVIKFRYCALVECWKKLGASPEEVAHLCKLARCGDYGMIKPFEHLGLEFKQLLSEGDSCCELIIKKNS